MNLELSFWGIYFGVYSKFNMTGGVASFACRCHLPGNLFLSSLNCLSQDEPSPGVAEWQMETPAHAGHFRRGLDLGAMQL